MSSDPLGAGNLQKLPNRGRITLDIFKSTGVNTKAPNSARNRNIDPLNGPPKVEAPKKSVPLSFLSTEIEDEIENNNEDNLEFKIELVKDNSVSENKTPVFIVEPKEEEPTDPVEAKRLKRFKKRKNLSMEFLSTEKTYVSNLVSLIDNYKTPIGKSGLLDLSDQKTIFLNVETLIPIHKKLLFDLEDRLSKEWTETSCIGDIIKTLLPFMKLYVDYVNGFDKAEELFSSLVKKNDKFKNFVEQCEKNNNNGVAEFYSLQICPIQRVPR